MRYDCCPQRSEPPIFQVSTKTKRKRKGAGTGKALHPDLPRGPPGRSGMVLAKPYISALLPDLLHRPSSPCLYICSVCHLQLPSAVSNVRRVRCALGSLRKTSGPLRWSLGWLLPIQSAVFCFADAALFRRHCDPKATSLHLLSRSMSSLA